MKRGRFITQSANKIFDKSYKENGLGKTNEVFDKIMDIIKIEPKYKKISKKLKVGAEKIQYIESKLEKAENKEKQIKVKIANLCD